MLRWFTLLAFVSLAASGCLQEDPDHCANQFGNQTCLELHDGGFCSICEASNNGCVDQMPTEACYRPINDVAMTSSTTDTATGTATEGTDTEAGCTMEGLDPACGEEAPFCMGGVCVGCTADPGLCASADPATPMCLADPDVCVACLDNADCPAEVGCSNSYACDEGCTEHSQCESGACDIFIGECFGMDERLYVDNSADNCPAPFEGGTEEQPYCTITDAIDSIPYDPPGRAALIVQGTSNNYGDTRAITEGRVAAIIGRQGPRLTDDTGPSAFQGSRMYISGVELGSSMQSAVTCKSSSRMWIDDTAIFQNATGIIGDNCRRLVVRRSQIYRNLGDGIQLLNGGNFEMYASAVTNNGNDQLDTRGIRIGDTNFTIVASTIVENVSLETFEMSDAPTNLVCTTPTNGTIRNSIIGSRNGNTINCSFTTFGHSVIDTYTPTLPMDVLVFDRDGTAPFNPLWFVDVEGGEVRLKNPGNTPFGGVAQWELGDPRRDIEGTLRMPAPGDAEYAGADQP